MKIGIRAWIDFAFHKIFGKPGNEICLISLLNAVLQLPHPVDSVEYLNPFGYKECERTYGRRVTRVTPRIGVSSGDG